MPDPSDNPVGVANPGEERLRKEIAGLGVDDILALCYAFQHRLERLVLYIDVLRRRGGERAQFASCLLCFDLARHGHGSFQKEFVYLSDTMRQLALKDDLVETLIAGDPYLSFVWELCQASLEEMDPRFEVMLEAQNKSDAELPVLNLLSDDDFQEMGFGVDDVSLWERFDDAVETFLGGAVGVPLYDPSAGFRLRDGRDADRIETFLLELESLRDVVPLARGYRALTLLFYGANMRSKSLFGVLNQRKQALLREGIREFFESAPLVWEVVAVFGPMHADGSAWPKICDILQDYVYWMSHYPREAAVGVEAYDPVGRMMSQAPGAAYRRTGVR